MFQLEWGPGAVRMASGRAGVSMSEARREASGGGGGGGAHLPSRGCARGGREGPSGGPGRARGGRVRASRGRRQRR